MPHPLSPTKSPDVRLSMSPAENSASAAALDLTIFVIQPNRSGCGPFLDPAKVTSLPDTSEVTQSPDPGRHVASQPLPLKLKLKNPKKDPQTSSGKSDKSEVTMLGVNTSSGAHGRQRQ